MAHHPVFSSVIPPDTLQAARSLYGRGNVYLKIGNQVDEIARQLVISGPEELPLGQPALQAVIKAGLLATFQYAEELSNRQMVAALRSRVDLKFALHLPLDFPALDPARFCDDRRSFFSDPPRQIILQNLIERLSEIGLFAKCDAQPMSAEEVLTAVCTINRFDEVVEATYQALEVLAITDPDWLRQIALPYWYDRYRRTARLPSYAERSEQWNLKVIEIGADIHYLLGEIALAGRPKLTLLSEIRQLGQIWKEQFELCSNPPGTGSGVRWRLIRCASCSQAGIK